MLKTRNIVEEKIKDLTSIKEKIKEEKVHTKSKKYDFLLSAKNLYLTYSNCDLELSKIVELLKEKLSTYIIQEWIVVPEYHKTRQAYVHVSFKLLKKQ